jgi:hypothetical protein
VEKDGFLQDCRTHKHWSCGRAAREVAAGKARIARPRRVDARASVVLVSRDVKEKPAGLYLPTVCADKQFMGLVTMQIRIPR